LDQRVTEPVFLNPFEASKSALGNLLRGNLGAAGRSVVAPSSLSPAERKSASDRLLGKNPGFLKPVIDTLTSPLGLLGLVFTLRYPVAAAGRLLKFDERLALYSQRNFPGMRLLRDFRQTFGEPLSTVMEHASRTHHAHMQRYTEEVNALFDKFFAKGGTWSRELSAKMSVYLDGLDQRGHPLWGFLRKNLPSGPLSRQLTATGSLVPKVTLTETERELAESIRSVMTTQFKQVARLPRTPVDEAVAFRRLGRIPRNASNQAQQAISKSLANMGIHVTPNRIQTLGRDYFPHVETLDQEGLRKRFEAWMQTIEGSHTVFSKQTQNRLGRLVTPRFALRHGMMLPSEGNLKAAGLLTPELSKALDFLDRASLETRGHPYHRYSLDIPKVFEDYTRGMARTESWTIPLVGRTDNKSVSDLVSDEVKLMSSPEAGPAGKLRATMMKETYIPLLSGQMSWEQSVDSLRWSAAKDYAVEAIGKLPISKSSKEFLMKPLMFPRSLTAQRVGSKIQTFLFQTTLGLNVVSPMKNLLQNLITTYPTIGAKYTMKGMSKTVNGFGKYLDLRRAGVASEEAFERVFPEFANTHFDVGALESRDKLLSLIDIDEPELRLGAHKHPTWESFKKKSLMLFTGSERFNRLSSFYGGYFKALDELPGVSWTNHLTGEVIPKLQKGSDELQTAALEFGDQIAHMTQFGSGPLNAPYFALKPSFSSFTPLRQFLQFPFRVLGFGTGQALKLGGEGSFNPGTLGRMMLASTLAYETGKDILHQDISNALLFGALPRVGDANQPFGVLPMVSPFLSIVGHGLSAAASGDLQDIKDTIPLLVPGGIQANRLLPVLAPQVSHWLGKPFADYGRRTPDGKVPVFTRSGALQGTYTPTQLWARAVGLGDINGTQEIALTKYLLGQRDRIRQFRRDYMERLAANDIRGAESINAKWRRAYPGLGPIQVKQRDVDALNTRREVPRLERLLKTLPVETRPMFMQVVAASMGARATDFFGMDSSLLGGSRQQFVGRGGDHGYRPLQAELPPLGTPDMADLARASGETTRDDLQDQSGLGAFTGYLGGQ